MSEVKLKPTGGGAGSISLKAPAATTGNADFPLVLPADDGSADQYLKTDGSGALSWATVSAGTALTGSTDNTVCTVTGANAIAGEANLTWDGDDLTVNKTGGDCDVIIKTTTSGDPKLKFDAAGVGGHHITFDRGDNALTFSNGVSERLRIDSSGNVGIATTSGGGKLAILSNSSTYEGLELQTPSGDGTGEFHIGVHQVGTGNGRSIVFKRGGSDGMDTESMRIQAGGGISFNGDTAAANGLDDYEEGTFTPVIGGYSSNPSYTSSTASGEYTKIGNICHIQILVIVTGVSSQGSGNWNITGMPFNSGGTAYSPMGIIGYNDIFATYVSKVYLSGSTLLVVPDGVTQSNQTYSQNAFSTGYFSVTMTYKTT